MAIIVAITVYQPPRSRLDYFPIPPSWHRRKRALQIVLPAAVGLVVLSGFLVRRTAFNSFSISQDTAEILFETTWSIPLTDFVLWTDRNISASTLSAVIKRRGLTVSHPHRWLYVEGHGNGCYAIGDGSEMLTAVNSKFVADFIDCAAASGNKRFAQKWLTLLLDPKTSSDARFAIGVSELPPGGFSNAEQFNRWWNTRRAISSDMLGQTPPDLDVALKQNHPSASTQ